MRLTLGRFLILEPEAIERDGVRDQAQGQDPGKRVVDRVSGAGKRPLLPALSSFFLLAPGFEPRAQPLQLLLVGMGSALRLLPVRAQALSTHSEVPGFTRQGNARDRPAELGRCIRTKPRRT